MRINHGKTGYVLLTPSDSDGEELVIEELWVDPKKRGRGIATKLVNKAIDYYFKQDKFSKLGLFAYPQESGDDCMDQEQLIEFYEKLGFKHEGYGCMYYTG